VKLGKLPGRFEWKILGAVLLVAVAAVGISTYALRFMLRNIGALTVEHHREIGGASQKAADVFRAFFTERKEENRRRTAVVAAHPPRHVEELAYMDGLLHARLYEERKVVEEWSAPKEVLERSREAPPEIVALPRAASDPERVLELTFGIPLEMYGHFHALQEAIERETMFDRAYDAMVPRFLAQYYVLVVSLLALAPVVGLVLARRVARRVARLHDAARRVGTGDLTVQLAPTGKDELDELGRAFDRMVAELAEARSRLEYLQKVSAWQEVARRLAHEIKNPLTPIQLAMQQLASQYRGDDAEYRALLSTAQEILHEEITSLRRLVDDFSAFAKLPKVEPAPVDLGTLVTEAVRLQPEWQGLVTVEAAPSVGALCDKTLFRRVIANLVENAIQATRAVGREPRIRLTVEAHPEEHRAVLMVDDNGPGVPAADRQRIFDPYVTHREGGTGLGLAIVRKIVIDHGGDVNVQSAPAPFGGARLVVEVPSGG
jgi:nitrogen fixation/metabolism regulation signal transduction histidine kinase